MLKSTANPDAGSCFISRLLVEKSSWVDVLRVVRLVNKFTRKLQHKVSPRLETNEEAREIVVRTVQRVNYPEIYDGNSIPKELENFNPFIDENMLLRVGGRLQNADMPDGTKRPLVLPYGHRISILLIDYYHNRTKHQGRCITSAAIRFAGYFIQQGSHVIRQFIKDCLTCKRIRGKCESQLMAPLPKERLTAEPPFTNTGLDVFGHWQVLERRDTRRYKGTTKV